MFFLGGVLDKPPEIFPWLILIRFYPAVHPRANLLAPSPLLGKNFEGHDHDRR